MDLDNLALVQDRCPAQLKSQIPRLTEFSSRHNSPVVPDPYYGGSGGFDHVLDLVKDACAGLLAYIEGDKLAQ